MLKITIESIIIVVAVVHLAICGPLIVLNTVRYGTVWYGSVHRHVDAFAATAVAASDVIVTDVFLSRPQHTQKSSSAT